MPNWLHKFLQTKYALLLEEEVGRQRAEVARERAENDRLRAENRALINSLLGTAGFPPVDFPEAPKPPPCGGPRLRKRSWHQIQAWRETEAARDAAMNLDGTTDERPNGPVRHS